MEIVAQGLQFPESPFYSRSDGCLYLVDWTGDRVLAYRGEALECLFEVPGEGPSGLRQDSDGTFWLALYNGRKLAAYSALGQRLAAWTGFEGTPFRGPCDLTCDGQGGVYFTDSGDFEEDWRSGRAAGWVYHLSPAGPGGFLDRKLHRLAGPLHFPNGIALSADGSRLFVDEHRANRVLRYSLTPQGELTSEMPYFTCDTGSLLEPGQAFELGPDGMCLGPNGCLFIAHYGGGKVIQLNPQGNLEGLLRLPRGRRPTSAAYHAGECALYITEAEFGLLYRHILRRRSGMLAFS